MDDQGRMTDFGIHGLDDHEFSQRTSRPHPNIGHHKNNGLDELEFTQRTARPRTNIGHNQDNGLDELEFTQRTARPRTNIAHNQDSGLDELEFTRRTTRPRTNIGHNQDNGLDDLEFSQRTIGRRRNIGMQQHCDDLEFDQRSARQHNDSVSKSRKGLPRAKWNHQMKLFLIQQLKDFNVPGYRTQNAWSKEAWSKEAWSKIVDNINQKFGMSLAVTQMKQKEQDLKKDFRAVKDLVAESGFGWDPIGMKVVAPNVVWESFGERNNKDALIWRDKHFPYYDDLFALYEGRYAEGKNTCGMDCYANKDKDPSQIIFAESQGTNDYDGSPSRNINDADEPYMHFPLEEEGEKNTSVVPQQQCSLRRSTRMNSQFVKTPEMCAARSRKRQRNNDFQEKYLKLKREEIERFAAIEEKKLEDPYSISKCIATLERLPGLQMADMVMAADVFKSKESRELFLSFSTDEARLAWVERQIGHSQENY